MNETTSRKIKGMMVERGLIQPDVAKALGISEHSMSDKISGRRDFKVNEIAAFADLLKIDRGYFFTLVVDGIETKN